MSLVYFDPSTVTVKQSFIVSQIVSCPVVLSWLVLLDSVNKSFVRRGLLLTTIQWRLLQVSKPAFSTESLYSSL